MSTYHGYMSTIDSNTATGTHVLDYSSLMFRKPRPGGDVRLWPLVSKVSDMFDTVLYWIEDSRIPITATASASGAITAGDTTLTLASGQAAASFISAGTVIRDTLAGKAERILVTAVSGEDLTITRAWGTAPAAETHANDAVYEVVQHLNPESSAFGTPVGRLTSRKENYSMIMDTQVKMSGTETTRRFYNIDDWWNWQVAGAVDRFERQLERALIWSQGIARSDAAAGYGSMYGIQDYLSTNGTSGVAYNTTFGDFTYANIDTLLKAKWALGYEDANFILVVPPDGIRYLAYVDASVMRGDYMGEMTRGMRATTLMSTLGIQVPLVPSSAIDSNSFLLLDMSRLKVHFLTGRELIGMDIPLGQQGNDYIARRLLTEFSLELHEADGPHHYARGVTYTVPS